MENSEQDIKTTAKTFEKGPVLTWIACAVCTVIFLALLQEKDTQSWASLAKYGVCSPVAIWSGKYWSLITAVFVHIEFLHFLFNVYWLWILGSALEKKIGSVKYFLFFIIAAFVSSSIQFAAEGEPGIGVSGVLYAMFGFMWIAKEKYPEFERLLPKQTVNMFIAWLFICIVATFLKVMNIANMAHIAGLLFGAGVALALVIKYKRPMVIAGEAVLIALSIVPLFYCPWSVTWVSMQALDQQTRGNHQQAINWYLKSLQLGGDPRWVWGNIAISYRAVGNMDKYQDAIKNLKKVDIKRANELEGNDSDDSDGSDKK